LPNLKLNGLKRGFLKTCCPRRGITNCQCPKYRVSLNLDVYSMGYILLTIVENIENTEFFKIWIAGFCGFSLYLMIVTDKP
jgi:hypothetical protein